MTQFFEIPVNYDDMSNQGQGYFMFKFYCRRCYWAIESAPIRSTVATASNAMDLGIGLMGGFWGRAAEMGQQMYGSKWHQEQAQSLQKAWAQVQHQFHLCPKCNTTVCMRCWNVKLNLCTGCAPDLKADAASFQHELNIEAQRGQIQQNYAAPQFNTSAVPSAVTPEMVMQQATPPPAANSPAAGPGANPGATGYPKLIACPKCRKMGPPGKFCEDCGTKLPMPDLFCPNCAEPVQATTRFCPECGTKLQQAT